MLEAWLIILLTWAWAIEHVTRGREPFHFGEWWDAWHWCARFRVYAPVAYIWYISKHPHVIFLNEYAWAFIVISSATGWYTIHNNFKPDHWPPALPVRLLRWILEKYFAK